MKGEARERTKDEDKEEAEVAYTGTEERPPPAVIGDGVTIPEHEHTLENFAAPWSRAHGVIDKCASVAKLINSGWRVISVLLTK